MAKIPPFSIISVISIFLVSSITAFSLTFLDFYQAIMLGIVLGTIVGMLLYRYEKRTKENGE